MAAEEARSGQDRANGAPPIFDNDSNARVIDDQIAGDEQQAEQGVAAKTNRERRALDGDVPCQPHVRITENPVVHVQEEKRVDDPRREAEPEQPPEIQAAGAEKSLGPGSSRPRESIDDAS